jgi:nascent polypeptide-associated complex subunit beta
VNDDKKIKTIVKKLGVQPLQAIDEVNFFKDDNTVMHFQRPDGKQ